MDFSIQGNELDVEIWFLLRASFLEVEASQARDMYLENRIMTIEQIERKKRKQSVLDVSTIPKKEIVGIYKDRNICPYNSKVKLKRAQGECLGTGSRRRT